VAQIIFLHGASSSGKSTLARALQAALPEPFWHYSIDHLRDSGVLPMVRFKSGELSWTDQRAAFFDGFHRSVAAFADAGNNLILEHILDTPGWQQQLATLLASHDMLFVGLHCGLDELKRREAARGDRPAGSAEADFTSIHAGRRYDVEIHTEDGADANAVRILALLQAPLPRSGFFAIDPAGRR